MPEAFASLAEARQRLKQNKEESKEIARNEGYVDGIKDIRTLASTGVCARRSASFALNLAAVAADIYVAFVFNTCFARFQ